VSLLRTNSWRVAVPGIALTLALALVAKLGASEISTLLMDGAASPVSPVLLGIVLGMLWRNFIGLGSCVHVGVQWTLGSILRIGIALVGLRLTLSGIVGIGPAAIAVVIACIATALVVSRVIGRLLGLSSVMQGLLAVGSAVCGCTAIVAAAPSMRARPAETGAALACVVLIGSLGMLAYPWLAALVFRERALPVGIFLGTAIHDTSQVIGASLIYAQQFHSPEVVGFASATKLFRNLSIIILVPLMASFTRARSRPASAELAAAASRREPAVPQFVIWFSVLVLLRTLGDLLLASDADQWQRWLQAMNAAQAVSDLFMTCGMTAVGLSVSLSQLQQVGFRPLCAALIIASATAICSLATIQAVLY
jgi:uncharacterized integral membrane protein (TIGR00698 family)